MGRLRGYHFVDSFWSKVDVRGPDECWEWKRARYHDDYGVVAWRKPQGSTTMRAHAFALMLASGEDADGRFALHSCDNPPCCNPAHLRWGDQVQNIADMDVRGRGRRPIIQGVAHSNAKLTDDDVRTIRVLYDGSGRGRSHAGTSQQALADRFGVSQYVISRIVRRKNWKHVI